MAGNLFCRHAWLYRVESWPHVAVLVILLFPPVEQYWEALWFLGNGPIELWGPIVEPACSQPLARVRVQDVVLIQPFDGSGMPRTPDAEWTDAELRVAFALFDRCVQTFDEAIDVLASPIRARQLAAGVMIALPGAIVGEVGVVVVRGVRIEVVVDVNAVDVVVVENFSDNSEGSLLDFGLCWIHPVEALGEFVDEVRPLSDDGIGRRR